MSIQFKKFLILLISLVLSVFPVMLYAWAYEKIVGLGDNGGDMFGAGIILLSPIIYVLFIFYIYKILKIRLTPKVVIETRIAKNNNLALDTRAKVTIILWVLNTALISLYGFIIMVLSLIFWAMFWYPFVKGLQLKSIKYILFWFGLVLFLICLAYNASYYLFFTKTII